MRVCVVIYPGFNELDAFANLYMLNRVRKVCPDVQLDAVLLGPSGRLLSMHGVEVAVHGPVSEARAADAVLLGSGGTREAIADRKLMAELRLDPIRQWIGSQCSGALILAHLGLLTDRTACTDSFTRPDLEAAGVNVLDEPFRAQGTIATAGGCLASTYLSAWLVANLLGSEAAQKMLRAVAPVGEEHSLVARVMQVIDTRVPSPVSALV
jgi:transcriptional regulator GlxA family with amidase domain